jgi:hypothetical protein
MSFPTTLTTGYWGVNKLQPSLTAGACPKGSRIRPTLRDSLRRVLGWMGLFERGLLAFYCLFDEKWRKSCLQLSDVRLQLYDVNLQFDNVSIELEK